MRRLLQLKHEFPFESYRNEMFKNILQHLCQNIYDSAPKYEVVSREGPDHDVVYHQGIWREKQ